MDLGQRYLVEGKYEEAIIAFNKVIELDPRMISAYTGLTEAYEAEADYVNALKAQAEVVELSENPIEAQAEYARLLAMNGDLAGGLEILDSLSIDMAGAEEQAYIDSLTENIINMCFRETFIQPEEMTVNGKPFWEASIEDAIAAYPCDLEEDVQLGGSEGETVYNVYHRNPSNPNQRAGTTKFEQRDNMIYAVFFGDNVTHRGAVNEEMDDSYIPPPDHPEIRELKIGDTVETVMEKIGLSEAGQKFLLGNLNKLFIYRDGMWDMSDHDYSWVTGINGAQGLEFSWRDGNKSVRLTLIFDFDGILHRLDYHLDK